MAVPKRRQSKQRSRKRRSHNSITPLKLQHCQQCGTAQPSHVACPNCGFYMGRTVVETEG